MFYTRTARAYLLLWETTGQRHYFNKAKECCRLGRIYLRNEKALTITLRLVS